MKDFNKIYNENYKKLYNSFYSKIDDKHLLEELIDDSFLSFEKSYNVDEGVPYIFLHVILKNRILGYQMRKKKIRKIELDNDDFLFELRDFSTEYDFEHDKNLETLRKEINGLKNWRMIAIWFFIKRIKTKDIADILDVNENTIKSRIYKIKKRIKKNLC